MRLKSFHIKLLNILLILAFCLCCLYSCASPALAADEETDSSAVEVISTSDTNLDAEILAQLEIITDLLAEEHEPVEGEITQAQFNSYAEYSTKFVFGFMDGLKMGPDSCRSDLLRDWFPCDVLCLVGLGQG